jgi:hypothetical protein
MPDKFPAIDYIKGYYDVIDARISGNVARARYVVNFSTGFLGVVGAGAAYIISQRPEWYQYQRLFFIIASGAAFVSFFVAVLLAFSYSRANWRDIFLPTLPEGVTLFTDITPEQTRDFEQSRYNAYRKLVDRGPKVAPLYSWAFALMVAGFAFYGLAATLLILFEIGVL